MHLLGRNNQLLGFACHQSSCSVSFEAKQEARWRLEAITNCVVYKNYFLVYAGGVFVWCNPYDKQCTCTIDLAVGQCSHRGKTVEQWCLESLLLGKKISREAGMLENSCGQKCNTFFVLCGPSGSEADFLIRSQRRWKGQSALCLFPFWR